MNMTDKDKMIIDLLNIKDDLVSLRIKLWNKNNCMIPRGTGDERVLMRVTDALTNLTESLQILGFYPKGEVYGDTIFREKYI